MLSLNALRCILLPAFGSFDLFISRSKFSVLDGSMTDKRCYLSIA